MMLQKIFRWFSKEVRVAGQFPEECYSHWRGELRALEASAGSCGASASAC